MSLEEALHRLRDASTFSRVIADVEALLEAPMADYVAKLPPPQTRGTKAVKDAVWGMIDLGPEEVLIVDSPPFQRLRRIRQLGLGHMTYPTAGYSRFEHSLGAMHQVDRMVRAIARRTGLPIRKSGEWSATGQEEVLDARKPLRLAALLHDIGHLPLSHVSERFYQPGECSDPALARLARDVREDVSECLDCKRPSLSECLSLATILAPPFWDFLVNDLQIERREVAIAAAAIVGRAPSARQAFCYQLITNVVDADKLDYMFRDAFVTGVPLAVDLERLLFKLKCVELRSKDLPDALQDIDEDEQGGLVLGIDFVGHRLAYDVTVGRTMLFERVYLHHKTRAAERVAMGRLAELGLSPTALLRYDDRLFFDDGDEGARGSRFTRMLSNRELPVRAYALSYRFLPTADDDEGSEPRPTPEAVETWRRLIGDLALSATRRRLESRILFAARQMARRLEGETTITDIWVDTQPDRGDAGTWDLWVETPDGEVVVARTTDARSAAYAQSPAQTFFVYASGAGDVATVAFLAAELVMATRYGLFSGRKAADFAKVRFRQTEERKRKLEAALPSVYRAVGRLRPEPKFLRRAPTRELIDKLASRFHHYHGQPSVQVDARRITAFLRQFPEAEAEQMLRLLDQLTYLDRGALGEGFAEFLSHGADEQELYVPLTRRPEKSGQHLPYFLADRHSRLPIAQIDEALQGERPLTFFDDCAISGRQPRTAVQTWLGLPADLPDEQDELAVRLSPEQVEAVRGRRVRFRFAYGHDQGLTQLRRLTDEQGLGADVDAEVLEERARPLSEAAASPELIAFLAEVGEDLLLSTKGSSDPDKWTPDRCRDFALGYGGLEQLAVLFYNVPTGTVTALWKGGRFQGAPWLPLFPRRGEPGVTRQS